VLIPAWTKGTVNAITSNDSRVFTKTAQTVVMGMCGGPVIDKKSNKCIGLVEALVHPTQKVEVWRKDILEKILNNCVHIDSPQLIQFIEHVESLPQQ
jgi:hypothetical protein